MRNSVLLRPTPLAAAILSVLQAAAMQAHAAESAKPQELPKISVGVREDSYKPEVLSSPKYTELLRDTPQTITVVTRKVMDQQSLVGLREVLSTLPGITFGAGEGGGGYGDKVNLRGFNADNDITIDGVRDSALYTRSDNFNIESLELVNGANSVYSGAGAVGGSINLVTKVAQQGEFNRLTAGAGTDSYGRFTGDMNQQLSDSTAVRLNVMAHRNDTAGRDFEKAERYGFAPSIAFGLGSDTRFTLSYLHQKDDNTPSYGVPYFKNEFNDGALPGIDSENYYGFHNFDKQENTSDVATAVLQHEFSDSFSIRNLTRWSQIEQLSRVTPPQGIWCLASGINVATGAACDTPGVFTQSGPAGTTRDTRNTLLHNQTDATVSFNTGAVAHTVVLGASLTHETFDLVNGNSLRNSDGTIPPLPLKDIADPDSTWSGPVNFIVSGKTRGELDNQALYAFDTLKFTPHWWLSLAGRFEHNEGDTGSVAIDTPAAGGAVTVNPTFENSDDLFSYRASAVYKPAEAGTIYLAYSNSKTPSKASVNGACTVQTCQTDPETAVNIEFGTKWDVLEERLALSASIFRNDRRNYKVADPGNPDNPSGQQQLDGKARVDGVSLGAAGTLSKQWSIFANYAYLDSEVLQSVSDFVKQSTGIDAQKGNPLTNTPRHSASLWTTYVLDRWIFGYGATYQGKTYLSNNTVPLFQTDDYWVHRVMASYQFNPSLGLQLNINNLTDKEYYARIRNNRWATPGEGRTAILSLSGSF